MERKRIQEGMILLWVSVCIIFKKMCIVFTFGSTLVFFILKMTMKMGRGGKNLKQKARSNDFNYISSDYDKHTEEGGGI